MAKEGCIEFKVIPCPGSGYTALDIYEPGDSIFTEDGSYAAFVGGCGVGHRKTLKEAKELLLAKAIERCQREVDAAQARVDHYIKQRDKLKEKGLKEVGR